MFALKVWPVSMFLILLWVIYSSVCSGQWWSSSISCRALTNHFPSSIKCCVCSCMLWSLAFMRLYKPHKCTYSFNRALIGQWCLWRGQIASPPSALLHEMGLLTVLENDGGSECGFEETSVWRRKHQSTFQRQFLSISHWKKNIKYARPGWWSCLTLHLHNLWVLIIFSRNLCLVASLIELISEDAGILPGLLWRRCRLL